MANFIKARFLIRKIEYREDDFYRLWDLIQDGDSEAFCESVESDPEYCWFCEDEEPFLDEMNEVIHFSLIFTTFIFTEKNIGVFAEYLNDNFSVGLECTYCDEFEDTTSVGLYRKTASIEFFEPDEDDEEYDEDEENYEIRYKEQYYKPKDNKQRHETFLMSWNGYRSYGNDEENYFNQLGLDDDYFYVKEFEDDSGILPDLEEWLEKAYLSFEEVHPKFF